MATTQSQITGQAQLQPFFWLRISGVPFYFFSTIRPGTDPFTAPYGYPTNWAQHGLMLPDETMDQKLTDIIGGVASPERIRLTVLDIDDPTHAGFGYWSRLLAPGRVLSSSTAQVGEIMTDIAADGSTWTVDIRGGTWPANSDIYVGAETIGISQVARDAGNNLSHVTIQQRNKYPAYGINQTYATNYPPVPYHRVQARDSDGNVIQGTVVSDDVITIYGRTAALYMGHFKPDGTACLESEAVCVTLGNITAVDVDQSGGGYQLTLESVTSVLDKALVAPDLVNSIISPGYYVQGNGWNRFKVFTGDPDPTQGNVWDIILPDGKYSTGSIGSAINHAMQNATKVGGISAGGLTVQLSQSNVDGKPTWVFFCVDTKFVLTPPDGQSKMFGLLDLLGFTTGKLDNNSDNGLKWTDPMSRDDALASGSAYEVVGWNHITAARPAAVTAIPSAGTSTTAVEIQIDTQAALRFTSTSTNIGGTGLALARFGDGQVLSVGGRMSSSSASPSTAGGIFGRAFAGLGISGGTGGAAGLAGGAGLSDPDVSIISVGSGVVSETDLTCYYVEAGDATIEQIIVEQSDASTLLGRLLCSTTGNIFDGEFNTYPEGCGLGWDNIVNKDDFRLAIDGQAIRGAFIDRTTKFSDIYRPIAREHGLFILWDPTDGLIHMRRIRRPSAAEAQEGRWGSTFVFSESNRSKTNDRTSVRQDRTSLRSSWKISRGWSYVAKEFKAAPFVINSPLSRSFYPNDTRQEEIEDKTLMANNIQGSAGLAALLVTIIDRSQAYQFPWMVWRRTVNKSGLMLSPGTYHQIIDNTIANPFTGARGITSDDGVYVLLGATSKNYATGECMVELYAFSTADKNTAQVWSPTGLIDFNAANHGYNSGTKVLTMATHYTNQTLFNDGVDFAAGDKIRVVARHSDTGLQYSAQDTIAAISVDGLSITLTTGLAVALPTAVESIIILDRFSGAPAARKAGGVRPVAWQGDGATARIQGDTTKNLTRWQ